MQPNEQGCPLDFSFLCVIIDVCFTSVFDLTELQSVKCSTVSLIRDLLKRLEMLHVSVDGFYKGITKPKKKKKETHMSIK